MLLEVSNLDVRYGRNHAVKGLNLTVAADELIVVLGANGAGKSSLLRAIQGLTPIAGGFIRFDGEDITRLSPPERLKRNLVLVAEGRQIVISLSVHENLQMGAYCRTDSDVPRDIEAIYDRFPNLAARRKMPASVLSGGEQQMLAIGRGLMAEPKLLILDEPSLGLSPLLVEELFALIKGINAEGIALLLVEQNVVQSLEVAERAYILDNGMFVLEGQAADLKNDPSLKRTYLGM